MIVHGYLENGYIRATLGGVETHVPDDAENPLRRKIAAWEAEGNIIPAYVPPPVRPIAVKAEAGRRIIAVAPEWKQRNLTARGVELLSIGPANWTSEQQVEVAAMQEVWDRISAIRLSSDIIEAMDPIPQDYADDKYWS